MAPGQTVWGFMNSEDPVYMADWWLAAACRAEKAGNQSVANDHFACALSWAAKEAP